MKLNVSYNFLIAIVLGVSVALIGVWYWSKNNYGIHTNSTVEDIVIINGSSNDTLHYFISVQPETIRIEFEKNRIYIDHTDGTKEMINYPASSSLHVTEYHESDTVKWSLHGGVTIIQKTSRL